MTGYQENHHALCFYDIDTEGQFEAGNKMTRLVFLKHDPILRGWHVNHQIPEHSTGCQGGNGRKKLIMSFPQLKRSPKGVGFRFTSVLCSYSGLNWISRLSSWYGGIGSKDFACQIWLNLNHFRGNLGL